MGRSLFWLFVVRILRSASQAYLAIIVPLYVAQLGYDALHLGILFTAASIVSALLAAATGVLADSFGRKTFLILISLLTAGGGLGFALSGNFAVLLAAAAIGTIGRGGGAGSGGNWGPFYPAEQALIAEHSNDACRTTVFGALSFVGVVAGALGSLLGWVPRLLQRFASLPLLDGYRALFALTAFFGLAMAAAVLPVHERPVETGGLRPAPRTTASQLSQQKFRFPRFGLSSNSWRIIARFMIANVFQGLGIGMLGPFIVYWFYRAFGVGSGELASLFFIINLAVAVPYLLAGRVAQIMGSVKTVALTRLLGVFLLLAMVTMPSFHLAALLYTLWMIVFTLAVPIAQSYLMGVIDRAERASAAGLTSFPWQAASSAGPYITGDLMQHVGIALPFELSALLGAVSAALYWIFFRNVLPPEEHETGADGAAAR